MKGRTLQTALVTGASAGIGREIVRQLVRDRGLTVLATARRLERLVSLAAELPAGKVWVEAGDLGDAAFRVRLWERAESLPGGCDLLVNNAGLGHYAEFGTEAWEPIERMVQINLTALMDLSQRAIQHMTQRGSGQILQISSVLGEVGMPYSAVYTATKHAVNGLVKTVRYELRGTGVRMWAACPARTESEFQGAALGKSAQALESHRRFGGAAPTDRVVRYILRGLDRRKGFIYPSGMASLIVGVGHWLPGPFEFFMQRWAPGYFRKEMESAGKSVSDGSLDRPA